MEGWGRGGRENSQRLSSCNQLVEDFLIVSKVAEKIAIKRPSPTHLLLLLLMWQAQKEIDGARNDPIVLTGSDQRILCHRHPVGTVHLPIGQMSKAS